MTDRVGRLPQRCDRCRLNWKNAKQQASRAGLPIPVSSAAVRVADPEPSKVEEKAPPRGTDRAQNQWARRGKIPIPLDGCPNDLAEARIWLMESVFGVSLYSWQREVLADIGGESRPRRAYVQIGRKNGKSLIAAAMILTELVLCEESAVYGIADSERNLNSVLVRELRTLIARSEAADAAFIVTNSGIEYPPNRSFFQVLPATFRATQGINPTLAVMDEVHLQKTDEIWNGMLMSGAARRNFMLLGITTPGYDLASFAHSLYLEAKAGTGGIYARIFEPANPACALDDRGAWRESNPRLVDDPEFWDAMVYDRQALPEHEFRRFRLGVWTATESAWLPYGAWDACAMGRVLTPTDLDPAEECWLGFDGSFSGDSTALVYGVGTHVGVAGHWESAGRKGWRVPRDEVEATISAWMGAHRRVRLLADPPYWTRELGEWQQRWPGRVMEFPTHVRARMAPACTTFHAAVMDRTLTHDGNKALARHVSNAIVKPSPQGDYITKPDPTSPAKIDLAVAAVVAFSASSAAQKRRSPAGVF